MTRWSRSWAGWSLAVALPSLVVNAFYSETKKRHVRVGYTVAEPPSPPATTEPPAAYPDLPLLVLGDVLVNQQIRESLMPVAQIAGGDSGVRAGAAEEVAETITQAVNKAVNKAAQEGKLGSDETESSVVQAFDDVSAEAIGAIIEKKARTAKMSEALPGGPKSGASHRSESDKEQVEQVETATAKEHIKAEIAETVEEAITDEVDEARQHGRDPTPDELHRAVISKLGKMLSDIRNAGRYAASVKDYNGGVFVFFGSVKMFDWILLVAAFLIFLVLYRTMLHWPSENQFHWLGLIIWLAIATAYFGLISLRQGWTDGLAWAEGYFLEMIFLVENVFVFHIVVKSFQSPRQTTESALFVVMMCQVVFQMVFYMGLAHWLRRLVVLPYILGVWLVYIGMHSAISNEVDDDTDFQDSLIIRVSKSCLGDRLDLNGAFNFSLWTTTRSTKRVTKCGLMVFWLLVVDFFLEVDVTVAKIEFMTNPYLAFSSSVVATFAVPELFFIARDIFKHFKGLKYGVSTVLVMLGLEMLLHDVVQVPAIVSILSLVIIMLLSGLLSFCFPSGDDGGSGENRLSAAVMPDSRQSLRRFSI